MYGKLMVWSGSLGQFMVATPGSIKADGTWHERPGSELPLVWYQFEPRKPAGLGPAQQLGGSRRSVAKLQDRRGPASARFFAAHRTGRRNVGYRNHLALTTIFIHCGVSECELL
jgi:hypothetical protein